MKINSISTSYQNINSTHKKITNKNTSVSCPIYEQRSNNIQFRGNGSFFDALTRIKEQFTLEKINQQETEPSDKLLKTRKAVFLKAGKPYKISEDAFVIIDTDIVNLGKYKDRFSKMKLGEKRPYYDKKTGRTHFTLEKTEDGLLIEKPKILGANPIFDKNSRIWGLNASMPFEKSFRLFDGDTAVVPDDAVIKLDEGYLLDLDSIDIPDEEKITIGSSFYGSPVDIKVDHRYFGIEDEHVSLTRHGENIIVKNIATERPVTLIPKSQKSEHINWNLSQQNVGDCYLLAAIKALSFTKKGRERLTEMVKMEPDGSYAVTIGGRYHPIIIKPSELNGQIVAGEKLRSVKADNHIKALERAYGRYIREEDEEYKQYAEDPTMQCLDRGGHSKDVFENIFNTYANAFYLSDSDVEDTLRYISRYKREDLAITCGTKRNKQDEDANYIDDGCRFLQRHAYAIKSFDIDKKMIEIVDPYNKKKSQIVSFDDFRKYFNHITYTRLH